MLIGVWDRATHEIIEAYDDAEADAEANDDDDIWPEEW
jgi:hypothetical protein